jgi:CRP-like cAMP-binding protein/membrane protein YdbS with pleckstrin-like domain
MPDRFVESHIRQIPKFAQMPDDLLEQIGQAFQVLRLEPGNLLFRQGEPARGLYMFVNGGGRLIQTDPQGGAHLLGTIGPNQYLNEAALYREGIETATLEITHPATVLHLPRQNLMNLVTYQPEIKQFMPVQDTQEMEQVQAHSRAFRAQRENEVILLDTRRHWWAWVRRLLPASILSVVLIILSGLLPGVIALALGGLTIVMMGVWTIYTFLEWRNDHVVVTTQRIIRIERDILRFETHISEVPLLAVQAVNADIITSDPFSRIFGYGTVDIRTAGDAGNIKLTIIPDPDDMQEIIFSNREASLKQQSVRDQSKIRAEIDKVLGLHSGTAQAETSRGPSPQTQSSLQRGKFWPTAYMDDHGNMVFRKHVAFLFRRMLIPITFLLTGPVLMILGLITDGLAIVGLVGGFFLMLIGFLWGYWVDWDWRNDRYVVGDERIQLVHQRPLWLQNEDDQVLLQSVDNVVSKKKGFLQNMLDYGDVIISLIGGDKGDQKIFHQVPRPHQIQAEITRRQNRMRSRAQEAQELQRREEIAEYLQAYHQTVSGQPPAPGYGQQATTPPDPYAAPTQPGHPPQEPTYPQAPGHYPPQQQPPYPTDDADAPRPPSRRPDGMRPPNIPRRRGDDGQS